MSKADNLKDFLTDVADAIREKKGTTGKINPQDFSSEIKSIETGGEEVESKEYKDVNFFDYEGTILYSYTWDEAKVMTELPPLPDRTSEGLVCQGWNYTLEDMMAQADENGENGYADIGAIYTTDDGSTRIHIELTEENDLDFEFYMTGRNGDLYSVDWGDGVKEDSSFDSSAYTSTANTHHYKTKGAYIVKVYCITGNSLQIGRNDNILSNPLHVSKILGIHNAGNIMVVYRCQYFFNLEFLTFHKDQKIHNNLGQYTPFTALKHISIPKGIMLQYTNAYDNAFFLKSISLPNATSELRPFIANTDVRTLKIPKNAALASNFSLNSATKLRTIYGKLPNIWSSNMFSNCRNLKLGTYKGGEDTVIIPGSCFSYNQMMHTLKIPSGVTTIQQNAFFYCTAMELYDFCDVKAIPALQSANAFSYMPTDCKIVVPDELVEEWKAATNWASYADYIIGKTEYLNSGGDL